MTPEQEGRLRSRILELRSLRQIYQLIEDLSEFQRTEVLSLPFFVLRAVLQDLAWRLEGITVTPEVWRSVLQQLTPPIGRVLDAWGRENREEGFAEMNRLVAQWVLLKEQLR